MTFNQVNYFLAVAKHLNFTRAATALFVTQSTLSRSILALEQELGVALLERDFHNVRLTPAGELMYKEMQSIMDSINGLLRRVQDLGDVQNDRFVIGILEGQSVESNVLFAIRSLSDKYPHLSVDIRRMHHKELLEDIRANKLDVAQTIFSADTVPGEHISYIPLKEIRSYLMARKDDAVWEQKPTLASLDGRVLVVPENSHPGLDLVTRSIREAGMDVKLKPAGDMETQALWLEAGMGVYITNEENIIYSSRSFRPLDAVLLADVPPLSEVLIWNKSHTSAIQELFLTFVQSEALGEEG